MLRAKNTYRHLLLLLLIPALTIAAPLSHKLHITEIASLGAKGSLSGAELYKLARHHHELGNYYAATADCAATLTVHAARCYSEDKVRAWGAEYFGALAALQAGENTEAMLMIESASKLKGASAELVSLGKLVSRAGKILSGGGALTIDMLQPTNYWDSLEAASLVIHFSNGSPKVSATKKANEASGVTFSPLITRVKLAVLISKGDIKTLSSYVNKIDAKRLPIWNIKTGDGIARFSDPMLAKMLSKAHYMLADEVFSRPTDTPEKMRTQKTLNWIRVCYKLGEVDKVESLLADAGDKSLFLPYEGWVQRSRGDNAKADETWSKAAATGNVKIAAELLEIWSEIPDKQQAAAGVRTQLLNNLGTLRDQTELKKTNKGRSQVFYTMRALGGWFYHQHVYDSAAYYYGSARMGNDPVSLDNYTANFCASYFSARIMSWRQDFQQEGYQGFLDLEAYYPSAAVVIEPLATVLQCKSQKQLE